MDILNTLGISKGQKYIISIAGSGGKTTLLFKLCSALRLNGCRTAALTTTHIMRPEPTEGIKCIIDDDVFMAETIFEDGKIVLAGTPAEDNKLTVPKDEMLQFLLKAADSVVAEADGSHNLPLKFPNENEPVILPQTTHLFVVAGLSAIGKPLCEMCHRWPLAMAVCGFKGQQSIITPQMFADILVRGYGKHAPVFILNQADTEELAQQGKYVSDILAKYGFSGTITLSLEKEKVW